MEINKKLLQLLSALWILIFHLWISVSGSQAELYIQRIGYLGVDIFFFLAAYSMAGREPDYPSLLKNRFQTVYLKFAVFVLIAALYKGWAVPRILKTLCFADFFLRGGGAFLWFIPAIMLFYLLFPLFVRWKWKYKTAAVLVAWLALSILSERVFGYSEVFIFTNRLPVILIGYHFRKIRLPGWALPVCLFAGLALLYFRGFTVRLNLPFREFYFVLGLPAVVGIAGLSSFVRPSKAVDFLGSATVEMYAFQMIFGSELSMALYRLTSDKLLTNLLTIVIVTAISLAFAKGYAAFLAAIRRKRNE